MVKQEAHIQDVFLFFDCGFIACSGIKHVYIREITYQPTKIAWNFLVACTDFTSRQTLFRIKNWISVKSWLQDGSWIYGDFLSNNSSFLTKRHSRKKETNNLHASLLLM